MDLFFVIFLMLGLRINRCIGIYRIYCTYFYRYEFLRYIIFNFKKLHVMIYMTFTPFYLVLHSMLRIYI